MYVCMKKKKEEEKTYIDLNYQGKVKEAKTKF